jgi:hypothetical protein
MPAERKSSPVDDLTAKPSQRLAIAYVQDAKTYVESARVLDSASTKASGGITRFSSPTYFLLGHAMELVLKAHLAASGVSSRVLRDEIGHNLDLAFEYAQRYSFAPADPRFPGLVRWFSPYHLHHAFRYRKSGHIERPLVSEAAEIISKTIEGVNPYVRGQFFKMRQQASARR